MSVAYLVNRYPATSHSFIRREIQALERQGVEVERYSIRSTSGAYVDPRDEAEAKKTVVLLEDWQRMGRALAREATLRPRRFAAAAQLAVEFAYRSDRGYVPHAAYLAEACVLVQRLRASGAEHVHAHFGTNSAAVAALCSELGGPPFSFTVHGPEEFDRAPVLGLAEKIRRASFVVAISSYGKSQLSRLVERDHWDKIRVVRCGLPRELLDAEPARIESCHRFVCVGRLHEQKGQFVALDAVAQLASRGRHCELVLAGDGPLRTVIEARIARLGIADRVSITGWLTEAQVLEQLRRSSALLLPSFAEGLPVVIMEAFALGIPVVSTYVAGIPELVSPALNGWLVPAGSVDGLVGAMERVLDSNPSELERLGRRGKEMVRRSHDIDENAGELRALIQHHPTTGAGP